VGKYSYVIPSLPFSLSVPGYDCDCDETVTTSKGRAEHTSKAVKRQVAPHGG
jgi:hypothetical protein